MASEFKLLHSSKMRLYSVCIFLFSWDMQGIKWFTIILWVTSLFILTICFSIDVIQLASINTQSYLVALLKVFLLVTSLSPSPLHFPFFALDVDYTTILWQLPSGMHLGGGSEESFREESGQQVVVFHCLITNLLLFSLRKKGGGRDCQREGLTNVSYCSLLGAFSTELHIEY